MRSLFASLIVTLALIVTTTPALAKDAVTQCGSAQLKALGGIYKVLIAEATRACAAGSAGNPQPVDVAKLTAATDKVNIALQGSIDKFGPTTCFITTPVDLSVVIDTSQGLANNLCLVP